MRGCWAVERPGFRRAKRRCSRRPPRLTANTVAAGNAAIRSTPLAGLSGEDLRSGSTSLSNPSCLADAASMLALGEKQLRAKCGPDEPDEIGAAVACRRSPGRARPGRTRTVRCRPGACTTARGGRLPPRALPSMAATVGCGISIPRPPSHGARPGRPRSTSSPSVLRLQLVTIDFRHEPPVSPGEHDHRHLVPRAAGSVEEVGEFGHIASSESTSPAEYVPSDDSQAVLDLQHPVSQGTNIQQARPGEALRLVDLALVHGTWAALARSSAGRERVELAVRAPLRGHEHMFTVASVRAAARGRLRRRSKGIVQELSTRVTGARVRPPAGAFVEASA